jgi:hypothetical protein
LIYDAIEAIEKAKTDDNIKGISIEADYLMQELLRLMISEMLLKILKRAENLCMLTEIRFLNQLII